MIKRALCIIMCAVLLSSGTGYDSGQHIDVVNAATTPAQDDIMTSIPKSSVKVMVNRYGYLPDSEKKVIFTGDRMGETFRVVNADTCEVVYSGKIESKDKEQNISQGNFSTVTAEGTYYVETDIIGRSYSFIIGKDVYNELFQDIAKGEEIT